MANLKWKWRPWGFEDSPRKWDCVDIRWWNRGNMFGRCWLLFCIVCWNNRMISWKGLRSHWSVVFLCELWDSEFMVWYLNSGCNQEGLTIQRKTENHRSIRSDFLNVHKFNLKEPIWIALTIGVERKHCGIRISSSWYFQKEIHQWLAVKMKWSAWRDIYLSIYISLTRVGYWGCVCLLVWRNENKFWAASRRAAKACIGSIADKASIPSSPYKSLSAKWKAWTSYLGYYRCWW